MGAVDVAGPSGGKKRKGGVKRPTRRVRVRVDMTPMVDVAFLLLIFFMVTTVFRQPQALEISLPPKDTTVNIAESNIMTLRVLPPRTGEQEARIYWAVGKTPYQRAADVKVLGKQVATELRANQKLVVLIKIARKIGRAHV